MPVSDKRMNYSSDKNNKKYAREIIIGILTIRISYHTINSALLGISGIRINLYIGIIAHIILSNDTNVPKQLL